MDISTIKGRKKEATVLQHSELRNCVKVEVAVLGSPFLSLSLWSLWTLGNVKLELGSSASELWSWVKIEVAGLGSPSPVRPYGLCGRKATVEDCLA